MAFVVNLFLLLAGLAGLATLFVYPKRTLFFGCVLVCGYIFTEGNSLNPGGGVIETTLGLLVGCVPGGVLAGITGGIQWLISRAPRPIVSEPAITKAAPEHQAPRRWDWPADI